MEIRILALLIWVGVSSSGVVAQRSLNALPHSSSNSQLLGPSKLSTKDGLPSPPIPEDPSRHAKIMKQINKVNDDGSYTFGYEADDGSFRVETRTKDGVVKGKYGYLDANGQLKVMEYTAGEKVEGEDQPEEPEEDEESAPPQQQQQRPQQIRRTGSLGGVANTPIPNFRPLPLPPAGPAQSQQQRSSRPLPVVQRTPGGTVALLGRSAASGSDQTIAAQTPTQTSIQQPRQQQQQQQQQRDEEREEADGDDDQPEADDDEGRNRDVNNGQYFRAISSPQPGRSPGQGQGPVSQDEGPRYVPTHPGPSQHFAGFPSQYAPQSPQQYSPQGFSTLPQQGLQGQQPHQQGFPITAYQGGQFDDAEDEERPGNSLGLGQGGVRPTPNVNVQFRGSPPQQSEQPSPYSNGGRPTQNPLLLQSPYSQGGFPQGQPGAGGFPLAGQGGQPQQLFGRGDGSRALSQPSRGQVEDQQSYVPNPELDGYSEDADEDGYVDEAPNTGANKGPQEKQGGGGVTSLAGGSRGPSPTPGPYSPTILGPQGQGVLQGGRVQAQQPFPQSQQPGGGLIGGGLGGGQGQGQQLGGQNPFFVGGGGSAPTLSQEQFQQFLQQQNEQFNGSPQQGLSPQAFQQQPGLQGGRAFLGGGNSNNVLQQNQGGGLFSQFGQPGQPQQQQFGIPGGERQRPGQFQGQPNSLLQGGGQGGGQQQPFAGFPQVPQQLGQQFGPQGSLQGGLQRPGGQGGQFLGGQPGGQQFLGQDGQGFQGQFLGQQGPGQGQFISQDEQQFLGQPGQSQFLGGQQGGGLPQGFQSGGQSNGGGGGSGLQSSSFPFDFNPFAGGLPGQLQGASPGQSQFGGSSGGLSPAQLQALQGQGLSPGGLGQFQQQGGAGGFPPGALQGGFLSGNPQGSQQQGGGGLFSPGQFNQSPPPSGLAGYVPGRFPGGPLQQQQFPQLSLGGQSSQPQGQSSNSRSLGQSIQLGGGPRPVQAGSSSTVYGTDATKQLSSKGSSSSSSSSSSSPSKPSN